VGNNNLKREKKKRGQKANLPKASEAIKEKRKKKRQDVSRFYKAQKCNKD